MKLASLLGLAAWAGSALAEDLLFYQGLTFNEYKQALALNYTVHIASPTEWSAMKAADFAKYKAIVVPDSDCGSLSAIQFLTDTKAAWSPAVVGNIIVMGTDTTFHATTRPGAVALMQDGIRFAASGPGTGLYFSLSCYYDAVQFSTIEPLTPFGNFTAQGRLSCYDDAHVVATSPSFHNITDANLSNWSCSAHSLIPYYPTGGASGFAPVAVLSDAGRAVGAVGVHTFANGARGVPFIVARGAVPVGCGDGVVQTAGGEQCDDGSQNGVSGGLCSSTCQCVYGLDSSGTSCAKTTAASTTTTTTTTTTTDLEVSTEYVTISTTLSRAANSSISTASSTAWWNSTTSAPLSTGPTSSLSVSPVSSLSIPFSNTTTVPFTSTSAPISSSVPLSTGPSSSFPFSNSSSWATPSGTRLASSSFASSSSASANSTSSVVVSSRSWSANASHSVPLSTGPSSIPLSTGPSSIPLSTGPSSSFLSTGPLSTGVSSTAVSSSAPYSNSSTVWHSSSVPLSTAPLTTAPTSSAITSVWSSSHNSSIPTSSSNVSSFTSFSGTTTSTISSLPLNSSTSYLPTNTSSFSSATPSSIPWSSYSYNESAYPTSFSSISSHISSISGSIPMSSVVSSFASGSSSVPSSSHNYSFSTSSHSTAWSTSSPVSTSSWNTSSPTSASTANSTSLPTSVSTTHSYNSTSLPTSASTHSLNSSITSFISSTSSASSVSSFSNSSIVSTSSASLNSTSGSVSPISTTSSSLSSISANSTTSKPTSVPTSISASTASNSTSWSHTTSCSTSSNHSSVTSWTTSLPTTIPTSSHSASSVSAISSTSSTSRCSEYIGIEIVIIVDIIEVCPRGSKKTITVTSEVETFTESLCITSLPHCHGYGCRPQTQTTSNITAPPMTATLPATTTTISSFVTPSSMTSLPTHTGRFGNFLEWFNRFPQDNTKSKTTAADTSTAKVWTTQVTTVTRSTKHTDVMPTGPRIFERDVALPSDVVPTVPTPVDVPDVPGVPGVPVPKKRDLDNPDLVKKDEFDTSEAEAKKSIAALHLGAVSTVALYVAVALCVALVGM
ncbi:peptidoglycan bound protein [Ophiostoma piceae UAMH 11346]|uniref:Peptidoglycan bound protein n=1 Tax=Ophiostoma piceae (strain UAMH 11346) TaxID=1262450 RepID=S3BXI5_OPHP1|nr:peptidoglycan bound protein [Ophiostoma piceae UAMH 11346]